MTAAEVVESPPGEPVRAERLRVRVLSAPVRDRVPMSFSSLTARCTCLVEVEAGGLVGVGESWINYPAWAAQERLATLCDGVAPALLGRDVSDPAHVQRELGQRLLPLGRQWGAPGPIWQALSAIDVALWDLRGKRLKQPVSALLADGATPRRQVDAYASGVGPTNVGALCEIAQRQGLTAVKTKLGFGVVEDEATLREARAALGAGPQLFGDANQAWTLPEAQQICAMLARYGLGWLEEPLAGDELHELEKLSAETAIPLATGENVYGLAAFDRYVASPAVRVIQPDLAKAGGFTIAAQVARSAAGSRTTLAPHCYSSAINLAASLHLAAAFPAAAAWIELDVRENPLRTDLLTTALRLHGGALQVPTGDGLGVLLDSAVIDRYQTHVEERSHHDD